MSQTRLCGILLFIVVVLGLAISTQAASSVSFDLSNTTHSFNGFGTQVWAYSANPYNSQHSASRQQGLEELNIKYIRIENYYENATWNNMLNLRNVTNGLGIKWVYMIWASKLCAIGGKITSSQVSCFASEWNTIVTGLYSHSIPVEYIELMNEPDSGGEWSTGITGSVYNEVVPAVRTSLDNSGYTNTGIVGPGLSSLSWSNPSTYIASISTATAGKLAAWSTHMWADDYASGCTTGGPCIEAYWPNFGANAKAKNSSIPQFVTEYATKQNVFNGVTYPLPDNYGSWDSNHVFPYYSATNTMPYAVRVYENTLALLNSGANAPFIWQLIDENTEVTSKKKAWGLIDLWGNSKPVYEALKTLCPKIPVGAKVVQPPSQSANNLYVGVFVDGNTVVIGITNKKTSPSSATILLQNAPQNLTVIEAKAFEQVYWGNPSSGDPDVGQTVDKVLNVVASDPCNYSLDVTLAANSTLTVVLRGPKALGDLNGDGVVDFKDISLMAANWLGSFPTADLAPVGGDGIINLLDFTVLAQDWLEDIR